MAPRYKFVEVSPVTDETLETVVNDWVARGWSFEGIRFVVTEHSKRPHLAFVTFLQVAGAGAGAGAGVSAGRPHLSTVPPAAPPPAPEGAPHVIVAAHGDDVE